MEFCPTCGNMLLYESADTGRPARFFCPTCPYVCYMESKVKIKKKQRLVKKDLEPVITDDDMKNASHTDASKSTEFWKNIGDNWSVIYFIEN
ncbi:hypothetical protein CJ030_MR3G011060 [Morella rubra]|uniref:DNA-directed RNA polymerase II subunit RPB9-like zinc ribbon domain-containing protein n=1 Tax=Morella rubra TaxID=262757 RepID=A0A6A1WA28_9ROSI|nr:hypothetical protein CJ030_MR3G011060 [Morella rubra]